MDLHSVSFGSSCCSLDSCLLLTMPSVPGPWIGGRVRQRAEVPDLLSEDVDERVERFMTLPPTKDDDDDKKPSPSPTRRKRHLTNAQRAECAGTPTGRRRMLDSDVSERRLTFEGETFGDHTIQEDVAQWLHSNLGWSSLDNDSLLLEQERMLRHWNGSPEPEPSTLCDIPETVLRSIGSVFIPYDCIESGACHPELGKQEAFMERVLRDQKDKASGRALEKRTPRRHDDNKAIDMKGKSSSVSKSKSPLDASGHVELYPGKQVKILDKDRAYASLANGDAAIFHCAGCGKCLLANRDTKLLYCSECGTLTPTEIKEELKDSD